jgi:hypothetical protein
MASTPFFAPFDKKESGGAMQPIVRPIILALCLISTTLMIPTN